MFPLIIGLLRRWWTFWSLYLSRNSNRPRIWISNASCRDSRLIPVHNYSKVTNSRLFEVFKRTFFENTSYHYVFVKFWHVILDIMIKISLKKSTTILRFKSQIEPSRENKSIFTASLSPPSLKHGLILTRKILFCCFIRVSWLQINTLHASSDCNIYIICRLNDTRYGWYYNLLILKYIYLH